MKERTKTKPGTTAVKTGAKNETVKTKSGLRENIEAILLAILLALFIRAFIVQAFKIPSGSMKNTLLIGDHILVNKFIYGVKIPFTDVTVIPGRKPHHGDIVVFKFPRDPSKDYIKRVVGLAGDKIEVINKQVYINGVAEKNPHAIYVDPHILSAREGPRDNMSPITVPPDSIFVMGDNRDQSYDSRFWGFVRLEALRGEAFMLYWSWNNGSFGVRWNRIGNILH